MNPQTALPQATALSAQVSLRNQLLSDYIIALKAAVTSRLEAFVASKPDLSERGKHMIRFNILGFNPEQVIFIAETDKGCEGRNDDNLLISILAKHFPPESAHAANGVSSPYSLAYQAGSQDIIDRINSFCEGNSLPKINPALELPFNPSSVAYSASDAQFNTSMRVHVLEHIATRIGYAIASQMLETGQIGVEQFDSVASSYTLTRNRDTAFTLETTTEIQYGTLTEVQYGTLEEIVAKVNGGLFADNILDFASLQKYPTRAKETSPNLQ